MEKGTEDKRIGYLFQAFQAEGHLASRVRSRTISSAFLPKKSKIPSPSPSTSSGTRGRARACPGLDPGERVPRRHSPATPDISPRWLPLLSSGFRLSPE